MSAKYLPAGYSDEEDDYDDYNDEITSDDTNNHFKPWTQPQSFNHSNQINIRKTSTFVEQIRNNDVTGVKECLNLDKTLINLDISSSMMFLEGGSRPIFVACHHAMPDMISL